MKLKIAFFIVLSFSITRYGFSQSKKLSTGKIQEITFNRKSLKQISRQNKKNFRKRHKSALELAEQRNWQTSRNLSGGGKIALHVLSEDGKPIYYKTYSLESAETTGTNELWEGGSLNIDLNGGSDFLMNRMAIWDGGPVRTTHNEFTGRVVQEDNTIPFLDDHATHVAGTMISTGVNPLARGMAYEGNLRAWDWNDDLAEMSEAAADGLLLSNHSYGLGNVGWVFNPSRSGDIQWEWWGDSEVSSFEDYRFGYYDDFSHELDKISNNAPFYLILVAAGNERGSSGPGPDEPYYLANSNTISTIGRRDQNSYDIITSLGLAKNVLTVGAVHPLSEGFRNIEGVEITDFSSTGPTDDGRIKPDLVANGLDVISAIATSDDAYEYFDGTSMAAPNVTGSLFLLQEYFSQLNNRFMKAATLKALVVQAADDAGNPGPDYVFGWGVLNASEAINILKGSTSGSHLIHEKTLTQNGKDTTQIVASGYEPLKVTICWNDPAAIPIDVNTQVVNNRTPLLTNDLDIRIVGKDSTYLPWIMDPDQPASHALTGDNFRDNTEQIQITDVVPAEDYQVIVSHKGTLVEDTQEYSIIVSGQGGEPYCVSSSAAAPARLNQIQFGSLDISLADPCSNVQFPTMSANVSSRQDESPVLAIGFISCENVLDSGFVHVFVDWNGDFDFADSNESVINAKHLLEDTSYFNEIVEIPSGLNPGFRTRMRIILSEDSLLSPCENYEVGQTTDLTLNIIQPEYDVSPITLTEPSESSCPNTIFPIKFNLLNQGSQKVVNVPFSVEVLRNGEIYYAAMDTIDTTILPNQTINVTSDQEVDFLAESTYEVRVVTLMNEDQYAANDTLVTSVYLGRQETVQNPRASICNDTNITLRSDDPFTLWYSSQDEKTPIGAGMAVVLDEWTSEDVYYAAVNDLDVSLGPSTKYEFDGGSYGAGFLPEPLLSTKIPILLDSARLYIGHPGALVFDVISESGEVISSAQIEVQNTRENAISGDSPDDLNDQGAMYHIGLIFPEPGNYRIQMRYKDGASIFRSNIGVEVFPIEIADIISLPGALFNGDTLTDAYYYFYDLQFKSIDCSTTRTAVELEEELSIDNQITSTSTSSCNVPIELMAESYENHFYAWSKDGELVTETQTPFFTAEVSGEYHLTISNPNCIYPTSNVIPVEITYLEKPRIEIGNRDLLISSFDGNNQWYLDGIPIDGATEEEWEAVIAGYYSLEVSENGCTMFSDEHLVYVQPPVEQGIWLYPNPVEDNVTIRLRDSSDGSNRSVSLFDLAGNNLLNAPMNFLFEDIHEVKLEISNLNSGVYLVRSESQGSVWTEKLIKK